MVSCMVDVAGTGKIFVAQGSAWNSNSPRGPEAKGPRGDGMSPRARDESNLANASTWIERSSDLGRHE